MSLCPSFIKALTASNAPDILFTNTELKNTKKILKYKLIFNYLSPKNKKKIQDNIIEISYQILVLENNINFIEWEENMIMNSFNIKNSNILNYFNRLINKINV